MAGRKNLGEMAAQVASTRDSSKSLRAVPAPATEPAQEETAAPVPQAPPAPRAPASARPANVQVSVRVTPELAQRAETDLKGAFLGRFLARFLLSTGKTLSAEALAGVDSGIDPNPVFRQETTRLNFRIPAEGVEIIDRHVGALPELATRSDVARSLFVLALDEFANEKHEADQAEGDSD